MFKLSKNWKKRTKEINHVGRGSGQERITEKKTLTTEGEQQSAVKKTTKNPKK